LKDWSYLKVLNIEGNPILSEEPEFEKTDKKSVKDLENKVI
jgi:hypothetical protein